MNSVKPAVTKECAITRTFHPFRNGRTAKEAAYCEAEVPVLCAKSDLHCQPADDGSGGDQLSETQRCLFAHRSTSAVRCLRKGVACRSWLLGGLLNCFSLSSCSAHGLIYWIYRNDLQSQPKKLLYKKTLSFDKMPLAEAYEVQLAIAAALRFRDSKGTATPPLAASVSFF